MFSATKDLSKRQPVSGRRQMHTVNLDYMISAISFESIEDSLFRFISTFTEGIIALKVEKVKAPQQWQLVIEDLSKHGPAGLPLEAVMMALKKSIEKLCSRNETTSSTSVVNEDPFVDAEINDKGSLVLYLYIPIVGYPVEYTFQLDLVSRERIDILETSLHEAREEIDLLLGNADSMKKQIADLHTELERTKRHQQALVTVLRTTQNVGSSGVISWNNTELNTLSAKLTTNNQVVSIPRKGIYQIHVRVTSPDSSGGRYINLQVNETVIAQSICGFNTGYNCSVNLTELKKLEKDDNLRIFYSSNSNMDAQLIYTHFSIMFVGESN